jgi:hypothetical protein
MRQGFTIPGGRFRIFVDTNGHCRALMGVPHANEKRYSSNKV